MDFGIGRAIPLSTVSVQSNSRPHTPSIRTSTPQPSGSHSKIKGPATYPSTSVSKGGADASTTHVDKNGASTSYEPVTPTEEQHEATRRHGATSPQLDGQAFSPFTEARERDVEAPGPFSTPPSDPYNLRARKKSTGEIQDIRNQISKHGMGWLSRHSLNPITFFYKPANKARDIDRFYRRQNERIDTFLTSVDDRIDQARSEAQSESFHFKLAFHLSFYANLFLAGIQVYGASTSGSLALFTTMADALFDPLSNISLIITNYFAKRVNPVRFPSGQSRIENVGNIIFCFLMISVSFIIIAMSARELAETVKSPPAGNVYAFHLGPIIAVSVAVIVKFFLFLLCWPLRSKYTQIYILWTDHRNDLIINLGGLFFTMMARKSFWAWDPAGAIGLSISVIILWGIAVWGEFKMLIGETAPTEFLQQITYISATHNEHIVQLDTVRAYHAGPRYIVEVDVVMDRHMKLHETHDIAEELQTKLESLPEVERCYVHIDFETSHKPEHFTKKQI